MTGESPRRRPALGAMLGSLTKATALGIGQAFSPHMGSEASFTRS